MIDSTREPEDPSTRHDSDTARLRTGDPSPDDADLLAELGNVLRAQSEPPADVLNAAREIYTWRTIDAELAALTFDSLIDVEPSRSRSGVQARSLTFEARLVTIELEVDSGPDGRRLLGQLVPPQTATIELRREDEVVAATADEVGRFMLPLRAALQRISVRCLLVDGTEVVAAAAFI